MPALEQFLGSSAWAVGGGDHQADRDLESASTHLDAVGSITEVITKGIKFATMMLAITVHSSYCWEIGVVLLPEAGAAVTALKRSACSLATCSRMR